MPIDVFGRTSSLLSSEYSCEARRFCSRDRRSIVPARRKVGVEAEVEVGESSDSNRVAFAKWLIGSSVTEFFKFSSEAELCSVIV